MLNHNEKPGNTLLSPDKIGDYDNFIKDKYENLSAFKGETGLINNILSESGQKILFQDTDEVEQTTARDLFSQYLHHVLTDESLNYKGEGKNPLEDAVSLEKLLGKEGLILYQNAIKEEQRSKNFRKAVFINCLAHYKGKKWSERAIIWAGGPSASGKSFASKEIIKQIDQKNIMAKSNDDTGNLVVAIDGGVEREVSQMRRLLLEVAKAKGYPGIKDLHANTKLKVKKYIRKAVMAKENKTQINLYIPATFSNPAGLKNLFKYNKIKNTKQIFSEIVPPPGQKEYFRKITESQGVKRAFLPKGQYGTDFINNDLKNIDIDNIKNNIESKEYEKKYFKVGTRMSQLAGFIYKKITKNNVYVKVINDQICVGRKDGSWEKCLPNDSTFSQKLLLSARDFAQFKNFINDNPGYTGGIRSWFSERRQANMTALPLVKIEKNDIPITTPLPPPLPPKPKNLQPRQKKMLDRDDFVNPEKYVKHDSIELRQDILTENKQTHADNPRSNYKMKPDNDTLITSWQTQIENTFKHDGYHFDQTHHCYHIKKKEGEETVTFKVHPTKITASLENENDEKIKTTLTAMFSAFEKLHPGQVPNINFPNPLLKEHLRAVAKEVLQTKFPKWATLLDDKEKESFHR